MPVKRSPKLLMQSLGLWLIGLMPLAFHARAEDAYRLPQLFGLCLAVLLLYLSWTAPWRWGRLHWLGLVFFAWRLLARIRHAPEAEWFYEQTLYCALFLWAACHLGVARLFYKLKAALLCGAALASAYAVIQALGLDPLKAGRQDMGFAARGFGTLGNPTFLAGYLAMLLPLALHDFLEAKHRVWMAALLSLALLMTQTRSGLLAAAAGAALLITRSSWKRVAFLCALGLTVAFLYTPLCARLSQGDGGGRALMNRAGLQAAFGQPWLGEGPTLRVFLRHQGALLAETRHASQPYRFTPDLHNDWLQLAAESGFPALLLFIALFGLAFQAAWQRHRPAAACLLAFAIHAAFHFPMAVVPSAAWLWLLLGFGSSTPSSPRSDSKCAAWEAQGGFLRAFCSGLCLAAALIFGRAWQASSLLNQGNSLSLTGQLDKAQALLAAAGGLVPRDFRIWMRLGSNQADAGQPVQAQAHFLRALACLPELPEAHANLGLVLGQQGRFEEARQACLRALKLNPRSLEALGNLGKVEYLSGDKAAAIATYAQGLGQGRPWLQGHFNLAAIYINEGKFELALPHLKAVLELDPGHSQAKSLLRNY